MLSEFTESFKKYLFTTTIIDNESNRKRPLSCDSDAGLCSAPKKPRFNDNSCPEEGQEDSLTKPFISIFTWMADFPIRNYFAKKFIDKIKSLKVLDNSQDITTRENLTMDRKQAKFHHTKKNFELSDRQLTRAPLHSGRNENQLFTSLSKHCSNKSHFSDLKESLQNKYKHHSCITGTIPKEFKNKHFNGYKDFVKANDKRSCLSNTESKKPSLQENQVYNHFEKCSDKKPEVCFLSKINNVSINSEMQTNDVSAKYKRVKYSYLNGRRKILTAEESVRLFEKEQYKILLQQHTSESLFNSSKRITSMKDAQVQSDLSYGKPKANAKSTPLKFSPPIRREKLDKEKTYNLIELLSSIPSNTPYSNIRKTSTPKEYFPIPNLKNETNSSNKFSKLKENQEKSPSPSIKNDDDDSVIITKVEVANPPPKLNSSRRKYETQFFNGKWLKELRQTIERRDEEEKKKIRQQEELTRSLREKREAKYASAEEEIKELLKRRGVAVLQEKEYEGEDQLADFPELSAEMDEEVDDALRPNPPDEVLAEGFRLSVARRDMETLAGLNWLNDEIINFYMNLLMERSQLDGYPTVYAFNTFFYTKLLNSGHSALKRWTRKVDIFAYDMLLIPVHMGMHWCLAVIDFRHKKIQYYDSMGGQNDECLNALRTYLQDERMDKKKEEFDMSGWTLETVKNIPHQMNGSDCGMFALKYAEYITRDAKINFTQGHMPYFRRRMVFEILKKQLL